jgi:hypothetical protein
MIRPLPVLVLGLTLAGSSGCRERQRAPSAAPEPYIANAYSVGFDIAPLPSANGAMQWMATYTSQGRIARFEIELDPVPAEGQANSNDVTAARGSIQAVPGSDATALLVDLKRVLEAKKFSPTDQKASSLPFKYVILGEDQSQAAGGGFNDKPAGHWTAMKIFIGSGKDGDDGEVFLNFNTVTGKAEFSEKDADYGDYVLAKLATVL